MLGFTVPLFVLLGAESLVGLLLLGPKPLNKPAIELARASYTPTGRIVTNTLAAVLTLLLASPAYDTFKLYKVTQKAEREHYDPSLSDTEAKTTLSLVLTLATIFCLMVLRKLGRVMGDNERMSMSEAALLKQVKGLQAEYSRVVEGRAPAGSGEAALEERAKQAEEKAAAAEKARRAAEANLEALKSQAGGLEKEYDRLLADHDRVRRQLAQATGGSMGGAAAPASDRMAKKDE